MTEKEATIYLVDLARSMGEKHAGREESDLEWALQYVWDKISTVVATNRKTLQIGIIGMGTDDTHNDMGDDDSYAHISVLLPIAQVLMPELRALPSQLVPSKTEERDVLSGIIIAVDVMMKHCKHLKYKKKIVLITNASAPIVDEDVEVTAEEFKKHGIELVVLGVDFDDKEYGFKEENKSKQKEANERILHKLADAAGGVFGTMQEAIDELSRPTVRPVRPTPTFKGQLTLGDPASYDTALSIDVERYAKTMVRRPPTASAYVLKAETEAEAQDMEMDPVHAKFKYQVKDDSEAGGFKELDRDQLAKGYSYGRTAVAISESEQNITKLETTASYSIIGFIPAENVERYTILDNTNIVVAQKGNDKAALALSSLIHALFERSSIAIARLVKKDMSEPLITLLSPLVEPDIECLVENILPFAEDVRTYRFPPIDKVLTISGKELKEHRHLPSKDLQESMSDFVDSMILIDKDDQGEEVEEMAMDDTFSPVLHTVENAIRYRAIHPDGLPPTSEMFLAYAKQPEHLSVKAKAKVGQLIQAADVKKVPPRTKGRKRYRDTEKPLSGLNVDELFRKEKRSKISANNAIPEFKQLLERTEDEAEIEGAVKQMASIVQEQIKSSYGEQHYDLVLEELGIIRTAMVELEKPDTYNGLVMGLKEKILGDQLGEGRNTMWWKIRTGKLGVITSDESEESNVSADDARTMMSAKPAEK